MVMVDVISISEPELIQRCSYRLLGTLLADAVFDRPSTATRAI